MAFDENVISQKLAICALLHHCSEAFHCSVSTLNLVLSAK